MVLNKNNNIGDGMGRIWLQNVAQHTLPGKAITTRVESIKQQDKLVLVDVTWKQYIIKDLIFYSHTMQQSQIFYALG